MFDHNFDENDPMYDDVMLRRRFREPGGKSALHPGKRIHTCPTCGRANQLTEKDKAKGYQCDRCADRDEGGFGY